MYKTNMYVQTHMYIQHAYRQPAWPRHSIRESTTQDMQPLSTKFIRLEGDALTISKETFFSYSVTVLRLLLQLQSHCIKVSQRPTCRTGVCYASVDVGLYSRSCIFQSHISRSCISTPAFLVPHFPVLHFWSLKPGIISPAFTGPAFSATSNDQGQMLHNI